MATPLSPDAQGTSTRPYLIRALHDWCTDNGFTPYVAVHVDASVQVPLEHVKNSEIVLNVGFEATSGLKLGNEFIEFRARFGGVSRDIVVPIGHVVAIYARENGQGMAFPMPTTAAASEPNVGGAGQATGPGSTAGAVAGKSARSGPSPAPALRLAATDTPTAEPAPAGGDASAGPGLEPQPPAPAGPARPSLKRVK